MENVKIPMEYCISFQHLNLYLRKLQDSFPEPLGNL